ncbi:hypothetical protein BB561_004099 [Smittium simulii]|uniref:Gfd2/YDR514C-like C-terminal domain-containing protein n=1 Tax=Smittium simulii TaxID=133385 RepID=A0A2T9YHY1_9FUNG|nr:hypothetical protein BB561_004099 [Smittium simulii]
MSKFHSQFSSQRNIPKNKPTQDLLSRNFITENSSRSLSRENHQAQEPYHMNTNTPHKNQDDSRNFQTQPGQFDNFPSSKQFHFNNYTTAPSSSEKQNLFQQKNQFNDRQQFEKPRNNTQPDMTLKNNYSYNNSSFSNNVSNNPPSRSSQQFPQKKFFASLENQQRTQKVEPRQFKNNTPNLLNRQNSYNSSFNRNLTNNTDLKTAQFSSNRRNQSSTITQNDFDLNSFQNAIYQQNPSTAKKNYNSEKFVSSNQRIQNDFSIQNSNRNVNYNANSNSNEMQQSFMKLKKPKINENFSNQKNNSSIAQNTYNLNINNSESERFVSRKSPNNPRNTPTSSSFNNKTQQKNFPSNNSNFDSKPVALSNNHNTSNTTPKVQGWRYINSVYKYWMNFDISDVGKSELTAIFKTPDLYLNNSLKFAIAQATIANSKTIVISIQSLEAIRQFILEETGDQLPKVKLEQFEKIEEIFFKDYNHYIAVRQQLTFENKSMQNHSINLIELNRISTLWKKLQIIHSMKTHNFITIKCDTDNSNMGALKQIGWTIYNSKQTKYMGKHYIINNNTNGNIRNNNHNELKNNNFILGKSSVSDIEDALSTLHDDIYNSQPTIIVGHNVINDIKILKNYGMSIPDSYSEANVSLVDTLVLFRALKKSIQGNFSFESLLSHFEISNENSSNPGNHAAYNMLAMIKILETPIFSNTDLIDDKTFNKNSRFPEKFNILPETVVTNTFNESKDLPKSNFSNNNQKVNLNTKNPDMYRMQKQAPPSELKTENNFKSNNNKISPNNINYPKKNFKNNYDFNNQRKIFKESGGPDTQRNFFKSNNNLNNQNNDVSQTLNSSKQNKSNYEHFSRNQDQPIVKSNNFFRQENDNFVSGFKKFISRDTGRNKTMFTGNSDINSNFGNAGSQFSL